MSLNLCTITGVVLRPDNTPFANGEITFASTISQVVQGTLVPATAVIATTDANGNINGGSGVSLVQGLALTVALSLNGNFNSQFTTIIPNTPSSTFANIASGILSLNNPLPITTGTWTPILSVAGGVNPTVTYTTQLGFYSIVSNILVSVAWSITWSAQSGGSGAGGVGISGVPFVFQNVPDMWCGSCQVNGITFTASATYMFVRGIQNSTFIALVDSGSNLVGSFIPYGNVTTGVGALIGSITYRTI